MQVTVDCPRCGQQLECDASLGGAQIQCPACHSPIVTPQTSWILTAVLPSSSSMAHPHIPPPSPLLRPSNSSARSGEAGWGRSLRNALLPLGVLIVLLGKFKALLIPLLKFFPLLLKTGGTMVLTIWAYAHSMGWPFAVGFVLLIFVHECGHLVAAKRLGLKVGAPVFIPFMGAFIALKEAPRNAWVEAQVGIGGPLLGSAGAAGCLAAFWLTQNPLFAGLAYSGFVLNLFNLAPIGFLDGGRIVTALSPWLWIVGLAVVLVLLIGHPNFLLGLILILSLPRVFSLFRKKSEQEARYFEVTPAQRWTIGVMYFGLVAALFVAMQGIHASQ